MSGCRAFSRGVRWPQIGKNARWFWSACNVIECSAWRIRDGKREMTAAEGGRCMAGSSVSRCWDDGEGTWYACSQTQGLGARDWAVGCDSSHGLEMGLLFGDCVDFGMGDQM